MTGYCKDCGSQVCECDSESHPRLNHCGQDADHIEDVRGMVDEPRNGRRDREADRERFPDPEFNRWLDEIISDGGHTVWEAMASVCDAWHGWENSRYYAAPTPPKSDRDAVIEALRLAHDHMRLYLPHYTERHNVFDAVTNALKSKPSQPDPYEALRLARKALSHAQNQTYPFGGLELFANALAAIDAVQKGDE